MKNYSLLAAGLVLAFGPGLSFTSAAENGEARAAVGSIHAEAKLAKADRVAMAKLSYAEALKIAQKALAGKVVSGVLEVEDGNLQYAFEIVQVNKKIGEVEVDAGNGKVLGIDRDDKD